MTISNKVYFNSELSKTIKSYRYPLHFIDFETTRVAIPFHDNMRPYEQLIFQWSCHTIKRPGDEPIHSEWLNLRTEYPNFLFAESLMKQLGNNGTVFIWSPFENTALKDIYKQMIRKEYNNPELKQWLENIIRFKQAKEENPIIPASVCGREGRFTDLHELTKNYYFHPSMNGKTSIKKVLPAVLQDMNSKRILSWLKNYEPGISLLAKDENNYIIDPYQQLPPFKIYNEAEKIFEEDDDNVINEGTGAMTAYQDIMIGLNKGKPDIIKEYEIALKRYCKLDTLAMVIIWEYWSNYGQKV